MLNIFRVRALTSSGSTGGRGRDAKTIISPNTSFGDIIKAMLHLQNHALAQIFALDNEFTDPTHQAAPPGHVILTHARLG